MNKRDRQIMEGANRTALYLDSEPDRVPDWLYVSRLPLPYYHDSYSVEEGIRNDILTAINHIESTYGVHVYCVICNRYVDIGLLCTLLTVSPDESEWRQEREDLKAMQPLAYVANLTYPEFSEWGTVVLKTHDGVVERIG